MKIKEYHILFANGSGFYYYGTSLFNVVVNAMSSRICKGENHTIEKVTDEDGNIYSVDLVLNKQKIN